MKLYFLKRGSTLNEGMVSFFLDNFIYRTFGIHVAVTGIALGFPLWHKKPGCRLIFQTAAGFYFLISQCCSADRQLDNQ